MHKLVTARRKKLRSFALANDFIEPNKKQVIFKAALANGHSMPCGKLCTSGAPHRR